MKKREKKRLIVVLVLGLAILGFIVFMDSAERRIPIQYAKRQVGRKLYGGQSTHLPIKVAMSGVMPIIFTLSYSFSSRDNSSFRSEFRLFELDSESFFLDDPVIYDSCVCAYNRFQLFLYFDTV